VEIPQREEIMIKMPKVVNVICDECGFEDEANWGEYGSEQPCLSCDAAPVYLSKVGAK
jgi:hypothetical protein